MPPPVHSQPCKQDSNPQAWLICRHMSGTLSKRHPLEAYGFDRIECRSEAKISNCTAQNAAEYVLHSPINAEVLIVQTPMLCAMNQTTAATPDSAYVIASQRRQSEFVSELGNAIDEMPRRIARRNQ